MSTTIASAPAFVETQWFYRRWWWLLAAATVPMVSPLALAAHEPRALKALLITLPLLLVVLAGLWFIKLSVRVDDFGIHYQLVPFLNRWRHWPWSEFRQVFPRTYSPLGDYGGWGLRGLPGNLAYNIWGTTGLQLVFRSGNKLLLGTQQPAELRQVLTALQAADATRPISLPAAAM